MTMFVVLMTIVVVVEKILEPGGIVGHDAGHAQLLRPRVVRLLVQHPQVGEDAAFPAHALQLSFNECFVSCV
jgi:hypothetical protein